MLVLLFFSRKDWQYNYLLTQQRFSQSFFLSAFVGNSLWITLDKCWANRRYSFVFFSFHFFRILVFYILILFWTVTTGRQCSSKELPVVRLTICYRRGSPAIRSLHQTSPLLTFYLCNRCWESHETVNSLDGNVVSSPDSSHSNP